MKRTINYLLTALTLIVGLNCPLFAAEPEPLFRAGEVQLDFFGTARTEDVTNLSESDKGAGLGINYFPWRAAGFGVEARGEGVDGILVDTTAFSLIGRLPIDKLRIAPEFKLGTDYSIDSEDFAVFAAVGLELRLTKNIGIAGEIRGTRPIEDANGESVMGLLKFRLSF
jgi:hypothetical protein